MEENRRSPLPSLSIPYPNSIPAENWVAGDDPIREVLNCVYPTLDSEEKRKDVIEYMQKLIRCSVGVEVFPYGSVPLKTYLPDGDIDLTVLSVPNMEDVLPQEVLSVLQSEEQKENTEFELKDVQFIDAEVKLVKCIVQDIVIDVSFNQLGGLCALGFLERVDRVIGKDHLFKRSIMLIKTWCYYESRILGAHYGLISTYALETLVLYIFHVFGAYLKSPLMVLYRFLDYYSNFDWDHYCISLDGPVTKSFLPNRVGKKRAVIDEVSLESPVNQGMGGLLSGEFLKNCADMFMVPSKVSETYVRAFPMKYLNIIDPLKENNNVGRSVHRGNYYRIRSAFKYGASKLGEVLESPSGNVGDGIKKFFVNTFQNHKSRYILDATFRSSSTSSFGEAHYEDENADLDDYISGTGTDDLSAFESIETVDLSAFQSLNLGPANELSDGDMNSMEGYFLDFRKRDAIGGISDTENLNPLADLTGDYDSHVRSLLYGQCCHGYALSSALIRTSPPASFYGGHDPWEVAANPWEVAAYPWDMAANPWSSPFQPSSSCPQMNPNSAVSRYTPYFTGHNISRAGEPIHWDERNPVRGTGPYFPVMNSPRGRGRHRGQCSAFRQQQWVRRGPAEMNPVRVEMNPGPVEMNPGSEASHEGPDPGEQSSPQSHGRVGSTRPVNRQRKLEFGSFGPVPESASDAEASPSYVVCGRRPGR
ncbi:uncharacterized protein LOC112517871 [Cynara cardunculus var. scolymus]|uniref:uncharacterized protein LOC112517871 n=1 Tax=Cynara cardunculus var. scolymus TaxID=59895 RepID=UPI000D62C629|nr:uncharacterized protein LOC112517871 [Cynara cardunculus var. scolymus]